MSSFDASGIFRVDGLVAVITGGGSGIGLMMTKALALNGAHKVYIIGRRLEVLEAATKESPHGNIIPIVGDVTSKSSLEAVVKQIEGEVGYINVLIANSGIAGPQSKPQNTLKSIDEFRSEMWKLNPEEFTNTFNVNITAVFFTTIAFLGLLDAGNKRKNVEQLSQVIATSSIAGFSRQPPGGYAYGLSKAACTHLVKQLATTLVPYDIRANALAPGLYPSDIANPIIGTSKITRDRIPIQRVGTEEDMAGVLLYLCSRAGANCHGSVQLTDGGRLSNIPSVY